MKAHRSKLLPPVRRDRHGRLRCRVCGCTQTQACNPPCAWADEDLCTGCAEAVEALVNWFDGAHRANIAALLREYRYVLATALRVHPLDVGRQVLAKVDDAHP